jgi:hypothetical protein
VTGLFDSKPILPCQSIPRVSLLVFSSSIHNLHECNIVAKNSKNFYIMTQICTIKVVQITKFFTKFGLNLACFSPHSS